MSSLFVFFATPCGAEATERAEIIEIEAAKVLPGIWKFPIHPRSVGLSPKNEITSFDTWGPEKICRVGYTGAGYTFNCLEIAERYPDATFDSDGELKLSWKAVLMGKVTGCHWTFVGRLQSSTAISGHLGMRCDATSGEVGQTMTITKMALSEQATDSGGQAAFLKHLLVEMSEGSLKEPIIQPNMYSSNPNVTVIPEDVQKNLLTLPEKASLNALGKISAVVYVGNYAPFIGWRGMPYSQVFGTQQPIYAVEFENGERLCTLRRRQADGALDRFQCI